MLSRPEEKKRKCRKLAQRSDNYLLNLCPFWLSLYSVLLCHVAPDLCSWATHPSLVGRCVPPLCLKVALSLPSAHTLNAPLPSTSHTLQHSRYFQHQEGEAESRCTDLYQLVSHQNSLSADAGVCCKSMFTVMLFKERQNQELDRPQSQKQRVQKKSL